MASSTTNKKDDNFFDYDQGPDDEEEAARIALVRAHVRSRTWAGANVEGYQDQRPATRPRIEYVEDSDEEEREERRVREARRNPRNNRGIPTMQPPALTSPSPLPIIRMEDLQREEDWMVNETSATAWLHSTVLQNTVLEPEDEDVRRIDIDIDSPSVSPSAFTPCVYNDKLFFGVAIHLPNSKYRRDVYSVDLQTNVVSPEITSVGTDISICEATSQVENYLMTLIKSRNKFGERKLYVWNITEKKSIAEFPLSIESVHFDLYRRQKLMNAFMLNNKAMCIVVKADARNTITGYFWIDCTTPKRKLITCNDKWSIVDNVSINAIGNKYVVIATCDFTNIRLHILNAEGEEVSLVSTEEQAAWLHIIPSGTLDNVFFMCTDRDIHKYAIIQNKLVLVKTIPMVEIIKDSLVFNKTHIYGFKNDPRFSHFFKLDMSTMTLREYQHTKLFTRPAGPVLTSISEQYAAFMIDYDIIIYELATGQLKWTWNIFTDTAFASTEPRIIYIKGRELYVFRQYSVVRFGLNDTPLLVTNR